MKLEPIINSALIASVFLVRLIWGTTAAGFYAAGATIGLISMLVIALGRLR